MSGRRRVRLPGRFLEGAIIWYVVQFTMDSQLSDPISADAIEDEDGHTGEERTFKVGDSCSAVWRDGVNYEGKILFASEDKEKCSKFIASEKKKSQGKRKAVDELTKKKKELAEKKKKEMQKKAETAVKNAEEIFKTCMRNEVGSNSTISTPMSTVPSTSSSCLTSLSSLPSTSTFSPNTTPLSTQQSTIPHNTTLLSTSQSTPTCSPSMDPLSTYPTPSAFSPNMTPLPIYPPTLPLTTTPFTYQPPSTHPFNMACLPVYPTPPSVPSDNPPVSTAPLPPPLPSNSSTNLATSSSFQHQSSFPSNSDNIPMSTYQNLSSFSPNTVSSFQSPLTPSSSNPISSSNPLLNFSSLTSNSSHPLDNIVPCGSCEVKEQSIKGLQSFADQLERDLNFWRTEASRLKAELDLLRQEEEEGKVSIYSSSDHYMPKRGTKINKCHYKFLENGATVPVEYTQLVEGHHLYVPVTWLSDIQGAFKGKTKSCAFKLMINGFFEPHEMVGKTGCKVADTPLGKALKAYALKTFMMDGKAAIAAINAKIGTMVRAFKKMESDST